MYEDYRAPPRDSRDRRSPPRRGADGGSRDRERERERERDGDYRRGGSRKGKMITVLQYTPL